MKLGFKILTIYLLSTYGGGWLLSKVFDFSEQYPEFYNYSEIPVLYVAIFLTLVFAFSFIPLPNDRILSDELWRKLDNALYFKPVTYAIIVGCLVSAVFFTFKYDHTFRHSGTNILLSDWYVIILFIFKPYLLSIVFREYLLLSKYGLQYSIPKLKLILLTGCFTLFFVSAFDLLFVLSTLLLLLNNKLKVMVLFSHDNLLSSTKQVAFFLLVLCFSSFGVLYSGLNNKTRDSLSIESTLLKTSQYEVVAGEYLANSYANLLIIYEKVSGNIDLQIEILKSPINLFCHRVKYILGKEPYSNKPVNSSVADYTYALTRNAEDSSTAGASPGLIGSALIVPYFPLGLVILSLLTSFFTRLLNGLQLRFSLFGLSIVYLFTYVLFKNPLDYLLNPSNPLLLYLILMIVTLKVHHGRQHV